jgi:hypothetical protein
MNQYRAATYRPERTHRYKDCKTSACLEQGVGGVYVKDSGVCLRYGQRRSTTEGHQLLIPFFVCVDHTAKVDHKVHTKGKDA